MSPILALILSAISTNGVHGYLLVSQQSKRKFTISEHAVLHRNTLLLYILGHFLGGAFFLVFAREFYLKSAHLPALFGLTLFTVAFEYIQAVLPARGKSTKIHTQTALVMWGSFITLGLLSIIFVPATLLQKLISTLLYTGLVTMLYLGFRDRKRIYRYQMIMVSLFYAAIFILAL